MAARYGCARHLRERGAERLRDLCTGIAITGLDIVWSGSVVLESPIDIVINGYECGIDIVANGYKGGINIAKAGYSLARSIPMATKRKFEHGLEKLSNTLAKRTDSPPPHKNMRLSQAPPMEHSLIELRALHSATVRRDRLSMESQENHEKFDYQPYSKEMFEARLSTYRSSSQWTLKPEKINEVAWAKRGWVSFGGKNRVRCLRCNAEVLVKLSDDDSNSIDIDEIDPALVERFEKLVIESHADDCLWKEHGCGDAILVQRVAHFNTAVGQLSNRLDAFLKVKEHLLAEVDIKLPDDLDIHRLFDHATWMSGKYLPEFNCTVAGHRVALILAFFGLEPRADMAGYAECRVCFATTALKEQERLKYLSGAVLDPLKESHRSWCPWVNGTTQGVGQAAEYALPVWKLLGGTISRKYQEEVKKEERGASAPLGFAGDGSSRIALPPSASPVGLEAAELGTEKRREKVMRFLRGRRDRKVTG